MAGLPSPLVIGSVFNSIWEALRWTWHDPDGYNFISGPLADVTLLGAAYAIIRRHNCHARGCWRIGRHPVPGTGYIVCRKHHPQSSPSAEEILAQHRAAMRTAAGAPGEFGLALHRAARPVGGPAEGPGDTAPEHHHPGGAGP